MKIMVDTNVLISAIVFGGKTYRLLEQLFRLRYELYVSDYIAREFREKISLKWPEKAVRYDKIFAEAPFVRCHSVNEALGVLRDKKDIPILSDAIYHDMDILLTGDKDFLESDIKHPVVLSPTLLWAYLGGEDNLG